MFDFLLAISHHVLIFALFGVLIAELAIVCAALDATAVRRVARIDLWYGIIAGLIVIVGFTRAIFAAKGWFYYEHNVYFWAKMTTFVLVALLSIAPTLSYLRWTRKEASPAPAQVTLVRRLLVLQIVLFALLPIFAAAMARGFGEVT